MKTVLFVCHVFPRRPDDHQAAFMQEIASLAARQWRVVVLAPHDAGLPEVERQGDIEIRRFRYAREDKEDLAYRGNMHEQVLGSPIRALRFAAFLRTFKREIKRTIDDVEPELVHFHWWIPGGLLGHKHCLRRGIPYVLTSHGTDLWLLRSVRPARRWARNVWRGASGVHVVSNALKGLLHDLVDPRVAQRAVVWPMPVDMSGIRPGGARSDGRVLFVGRLVERKGAHVLIEAVRLLREDGVDVHLDVVGDGPERAALQAQATPVGERITFHGPVSRAELIKAYQSATVLAFPSISTRRGEAEGLGVVLLEAMAAGLPTIGSDSGGIGDVILHEETGLLSPEGDAAALADALRRMLGDAALRRRLAKNAARRLERFGYDATADRLMALYGSV